METIYNLTLTQRLASLNENLSLWLCENSVGENFEVLTISKNENIEYFKPKPKKTTLTKPEKKKEETVYVEKTIIPPKVNEPSLTYGKETKPKQVKPLAKKKNTEKLPKAIVEPNKETSNKAIKPQRTFQIGVVAGSHFYQGYKNMGEKRIPLSNDYFGGLYIKTAFNNKWSGKIGLNYWQRDALNSVINVDSTVYGFGSTVYSKTVNLHGIQAIELPISVALDFGKSALTAGIQVNYILNSKGTYQETVSDAFSTINRGEITQNGYQTLFNRLDFGLSIGYEYKMTDLINLGAQAQMGFVDVTKNAIFKNTTTDRNLMLKVYATYDFWIFGNKNKSLPFQINR